ncbi:hypothetical protein [Pseudomonas flexibilis]|nr:hypothetical protein [Pseudomonas flexibilis]SCY31283.1 hypothetical protein SAMN02927929_02242 [Pseudomonas flexibilis]
MATAKKVVQPQRKAIGKVLTYKDVVRAAQDGQKSFEHFVATGKLPVDK